MHSIMWIATSPMRTIIIRGAPRFLVKCKRLVFTQGERGAIRAQLHSSKAS